MYWKAATTGNQMHSLGEVSTIMDNYGFTGSWRANDNDAGTIWNASDPEDPDTWLWMYLPNVFILHTESMQIVLTQDIDGEIDVPKEVAAINSE